MLLLRTSRGVDPGIPLLRSLGSNAHVWLPGANGVSVASLPSNNYLLSDGSTGYSTVDGVDGLTLDGMGATGVEKLTNGDFSAGTTGWTAVNSPTLSISASGVAIQNAGATNGLIYQAKPTVVGKTYKISGTIVYGGVGVARVEPSNTIPTTVGGGYISVTTSGSYECFFVATATTTYIVVGNRNDSNATHTYDNISVKEYTGIHLTQATTANKPLVRRGMLNYLPYSGSFITNWPGSNMTKVAASDPYGGMTATQITTTGGTVNLYANYVPLSAGGVTMAAIVKGVAGSTHSNVFGVYNQTTGLDLLYASVNCLTGAVTSGTGTSTPLGDGWFLVVINIPTGINSGNLGYIYAGYAGSVVPTGQAHILYRAALFHGIYTAAQILAEGGIPTTTATAASNPSAGKYWWSFDGSNDSLLSGNLGITNACTIVIAGRLNSLSATQLLFGEDTTGLAFYIEGTTGIVIASKNGTAQLVNSTGFPVTAGVPFVLTFRLSGGTAVIRRNGVQVATAGTALTFAATTGARIGSDFAGTSYPFNGALGWVVPLPTALSDADCLTVERLVSSQFPNGPVF